MLTYHFFREILVDNVFELTVYDFFIFLLACIFSIPVDIILSPIEISAAIIYLLYKIIKKIGGKR